ncbi:hypothetical protein [Algoriphagus sp. CAU 1675]|uniref:hypothetical protein n=1 Tax=Algoriphagus sp. CAU 1675 TaxID=3032597 RepID=UPI0023DB957B|nr:hypothetical protein [Algoriphagus sp. CAU 1675]MDF2158978.1 hypothetical protein [Algoriphagus sp. CAU 1675]
MKKLKFMTILTMGLILNFVVPFQPGFGQGSCIRTDYYDGCGELIWTTGDPSCPYVNIVIIETECDT